MCDECDVSSSVQTEQLTDLTACLTVSWARCSKR